MTYDAERVRTYFDGFAEREWSRLESTLQGRASFAVHARFIDRYVRPDMRVLDVGSGPGRFAIHLAQAGARVVVGDLSTVQLALARRQLASSGVLDRVDDLRALDVTDMSCFADQSFDLIVCYGGVLSYTRDQHPRALRELRRVLRPNGIVLISVISLYGTLRLVGPLDAAAFLEEFDSHVDWNAVMAAEGVVYTRIGSPEFHQPMALFSSDGLRAAIARAGLLVERTASANPLMPEYSKVPRIEASRNASAALQELELAVCEVPGLIDAGTHLVVAARRPGSAA